MLKVNICSVVLEFVLRCFETTQQFQKCIHKISKSSKKPTLQHMPANHTTPPATTPQNQPATHLANQPHHTSPPYNQPTSQPTNQQTNQTTNHPINQSWQQPMQHPKDPQLEPPLYKCQQCSWFIRFIHDAHMSYKVQSSKA